MTAGPVNGVPLIRTGLFISCVRSSVAGAAERGQVSGPCEGSGTAGGPRCSFHARYGRSGSAGNRGCRVHDNASAE